MVVSLTCQVRLCERSERFYIRIGKRFGCERVCEAQDTRLLNLYRNVIAIQLNLQILACFLSKMFQDLPKRF